MFMCHSAEWRPRILVFLGVATDVLVVMFKIQKFFRVNTSFTSEISNWIFIENLLYVRYFTINQWARHSLCFAEHQEQESEGVSDIESFIETSAGGHRGMRQFPGRKIWKGVMEEDMNWAWRMGTILRYNCWLVSAHIGMKTWGSEATRLPGILVHVWGTKSACWTHGAGGSPSCIPRVVEIATNNLFTME